MLGDVRISRETALVDIYAGLRRIGYTKFGAIRAIRALGVSLGDAKQAADVVEALPRPALKCNSPAA